MVIARLSGGLGNQMFQYATAKQVAKRINAPLKLDTVSGYWRDYYNRSYGLMHFDIKAHKTNLVETVMGVMLSLCHRVAEKAHKEKNIFHILNCEYVQEIPGQYNDCLDQIKPGPTVYLNGYWQRQKYFEDIKEELQKDFKVITPVDQANLEMAEHIRTSNSVCIHVRRLHGVGVFDKAQPLSDKDPRSNKVGLDYYESAIAIITESLEKPHFFVFSDFPQWAKENLTLKNRVTLVTGNAEIDDKSHLDLWLMSLCRHHIVANSTFSWWGGLAKRQ